MAIRRFLSVLSLIVFSLIARSQPVDWTGDMTVFGTAGDEKLPSLSAKPGSTRLRAFCILDGTTLCSKTSATAGADWISCGTLISPMNSPRLTVISDAQYDFAILSSSVSATKTLFRFGTGQNDWQAATQHAAAPGCTGNVQCMAMTSDCAIPSSSSYLNMAWMERQPQTNHFSLWFVQSRDRGDSFQTEHELNAFDSPDAQPEDLGIAVSWQGNAERIVVAAPIDRAGTIPEEIRIFTSDDQGVTWGDSTQIDDATFPQSEVSVATYENTVMLAYSRRINAGAQRDIFFSYSPDGGLHFSPPVAITDSMADEHDPRVVISADGLMCSIAYLADNCADEPATVHVRRCAVATPWELEERIMISEVGGAVRNGKLCATAADLGIALMWTSRFPLGDTDVRFDAQWRGVDSPDRSSAIPTESAIGQNYPNPFNGITILPLSLNREREISVLVSDVLGRSVMSKSLGFLSAGTHQIPLDLSTLPSGAYWTRVQGVSGSARKAILLK